MVNSQHTFSTRRLAGSDMQHLSRHSHWSLDFEPLVLCTFDQISTDCDSQSKTRNMLGFSLEHDNAKNLLGPREEGSSCSKLLAMVGSCFEPMPTCRQLLWPFQVHVETSQYQHNNVPKQTGADLSQDSSHSWRKEWCECGELSQLPLQLPLSQVLKASPFCTQSSTQIHMTGTKNPRHFRKATANDCT